MNVGAPQSVAVAGAKPRRHRRDIAEHDRIAHLPLKLSE
jgi:hypothetical protein